MHTSQCTLVPVKLWLVRSGLFSTVLTGIWVFTKAPPNTGTIILLTCICTSINYLLMRLPQCVWETTIGIVQFIDRTLSHACMHAYIHVCTCKSCVTQDGNSCRGTVYTPTHTHPPQPFLGEVPNLLGSMCMLTKCSHSLLWILYYKVYVYNLFAARWNESNFLW